MIFTTNKALKPGAASSTTTTWRRPSSIGSWTADGSSAGWAAVRTLHVDLDDAMKDGSDSEDDVIRISGIQCPEFPEPTKKCHSRRTFHRAFPLERCPKASPLDTTALIGTNELPPCTQMQSPKPAERCSEASRRSETRLAFGITTRQSLSAKPKYKSWSASSGTRDLLAAEDGTG